MAPRGSPNAPWHLRLATQAIRPIVLIAAVWLGSLPSAHARPPASQPVAVLHHDARIAARGGRPNSSEFNLHFRLPRHAHDGGHSWYLLRLVAVLHLHRGISGQDTGNLFANMNGRTGLSPLVTGTRVHGKPEFLIRLLDLIVGNKNIRTTAATVRIHEENYGQIRTTVRSVASKVAATTSWSHSPTSGAIPRSRGLSCGRGQACTSPRSHREQRSQSSSLQRDPRARDRRRSPEIAVAGANPERTRARLTDLEARSAPSYACDDEHDQRTGAHAEGDGLSPAHIAVQLPRITTTTNTNASMNRRSLTRGTVPRARPGFTPCWRVVAGTAGHGDERQRYRDRRDVSNRILLRTLSTCPQGNAYRTGVRQPQVARRARERRSWWTRDLVS